MIVSALTRLRKSFLSVAIAFCVVTLLVVTELFGAYVAVRGVYALVGLVVALLLVNLPDWLDGRDGSARLEPYGVRAARHAAKVTFVLFGLAVATAGVLDSRWPLLLIVLPAMYLVVGAQLASGRDDRLLAQLVALFLVTPLTKYVHTDFYFGNTDTILHVGAVRSVVRTGGVSAIDVKNYRDLPVLHVLASLLDLVGGLSAYDAVLVVGILSFAILLVVWFLFVELTVGNRRLALNTTFGLLVLHPFLYYSTYFFPQAMAITFWLLLLYLLLRSRLVGGVAAVKYLSLAGVVVLALVLTHHFTFVLMTPILVVLFASGLVTRRVFDVDIALPGPKPVLATFLTGGVYLLWVEKQFVVEFLTILTSAFVRNVLAKGSGVSQGVSVYALGFAVSERTVADAVRSLADPISIYYALHVAVFAVGVAALLRRPRRHRRYAHLAVTGLFAAAFIFQTPLVLQGGIRRIRLPMTFFFAFVTGLGLTQLVRERSPSVGYVAIVVAVMVVLGTTSSVMVADDAPEVFSNDDVPPQQVEFTTQEYEQLRAVAGWVGQRELDPTTLFLTRRVLASFGVETDGYVVEVSDGLRTDGELLLYRTNWGQTSVSVNLRNSPEDGAIYIADSWVRDTVASTGKVYTTGRVGVLWNETRYFGPDSPVENSTPRRTSAVHGPALESDGDDPLLALRGLALGGTPRSLASSSFAPSDGATGLRTASRGRVSRG